MFRYKFLIICFFLSVSTFLSAQNEYKPLRTFIKNGGNLAQAMAVVQGLEKDDDFKDEPELYYLAALCQRKANDVNNTKVYLKQAYDTVSFFNTTYGMFEYIFKCDQKDQLPGKNGKVKLKYRSKGYDMLCNYYPNLYNAGIFFTRKKDFASASKFWNMYMEVAQSPIFEKNNFTETDPKLPRAAFWYMSCCYEMKDYKGVFKYSDFAVKDTANTDLYLQYRAVSYAHLNDTLNYEKELLQGFKTEPSDLFFFTNLTDYYNKTQQYDKAMEIVNSLLSTNPNSSMAKFAQAVIMYNMKKYDECISISEDILQRDTLNADVYFYTGSCYYSKALIIDENISPNVNAKDFSIKKKQAKELFQKAMPCLEKYRAMMPNDKDRWAPLLYKTYLYLNMEKKFAELDTLLNQQEQAGKK